MAVSAGAHYRVGIDVVSDRDVMVDAGTGVDVAGLLETGIPVTPEMSGGPLVDPDGNLAAGDALRAWRFVRLNDALRMRLGPAVAWNPDQQFGLFNLFWG